jgi:hypothetical protein
MSESDEHDPVCSAAARLQELRARAVLIRDSARFTPMQKEQARRALAADMLRASARYRVLVAAEDGEPSGSAGMHRHG